MGRKPGEPEIPHVNVVGQDELFYEVEGLQPGQEVGVGADARAVDRVREKVKEIMATLGEGYELVERSRGPHGSIISIKRVA